MRRIKVVLTPAERKEEGMEGGGDSVRTLLACVRTIKPTPNLLMHITAAASSF